MAHLSDREGRVLTRGVQIYSNGVIALVTLWKLEYSSPDTPLTPLQARSLVAMGPLSRLYHRFHARYVASLLMLPHHASRPLTRLALTSPARRLVRRDHQHHLHHHRPNVSPPPPPPRHPLPLHRHSLTPHPQNNHQPLPRPLLHPSITNGPQLARLNADWVVERPYYGPSLVSRRPPPTSGSTGGQPARRAPWASSAPSSSRSRPVRVPGVGRYARGLVVT